jgi:hypothetical protein
LNPSQLNEHHLAKSQLNEHHLAKSQLNEHHLAKSQMFSFFHLTKLPSSQRMATLIILQTDGNMTGLDKLRFNQLMFTINVLDKRCLAK